MKVIGLISWFDEPAEWLHTAAASLADVVDEIVAVDGPYARFPHSSVASPQHNLDAIGDACRTATTPWYIEPGRVYQTQADKRTHAMRLACERGTYYQDWMLVLDADEYVERSNVARIEQILRHTQAHTGNVHIYTEDPGQTDEEVLLQRSDYVGRSGPQPRYWRMLRDMRVEPPTHWIYTGIDQSGRRVCVKGQAASGMPNGDVVDLSGALVIRHRTLNRSLERKRAKAAYYDDRRRAGEDT